jgi:predicted negative regulator of RcsB-dependent stress response
LATTTKLDKHDLKAPDEFLSTGSKVAAYVAENAAMVIGGVLLALVAIAAGFGWLHQQQVREIEASGKLFAGEKILQSDDPMRMFGMALPSAADAEDKKKAIEAFDKVATEYAGSAAARRARLRSGDVYLELGEYDSAITSYEQALNGAGPEETFYARNGIAHSQEAKQAWDDAIATYRKLVDDESLTMRDVATVDLARVLIRAGKNDEARELLSAFSTKFPESSLKDSAEKELAKVGGPIATPTTAPDANPATTDADGS